MTRRNGIYQPKSPTHNSLLLDCCERVKKRFLIRRRKSLLDCARIKTLLEHPLNLPVDILVKNPCVEENPFVSMVRAKAKLLEIT